MSSVGFEPAIPAIKRPWTYALDRNTNGTGNDYSVLLLGSVFISKKRIHNRTTMKWTLCMYVYTNNMYRDTSQFLTVTTGMYQKVGQRKWNRLRKRIYECGGKVKQINMTDDYPAREESFPVALRSTFHCFAYQLSYYYHFSYKFHLSQRQNYDTANVLCTQSYTIVCYTHIVFTPTQKGTWNPLSPVTFGHKMKFITYVAM
jgi:hypothetical protein